MPRISGFVSCALQKFYSTMDLSLLWLRYKVFKQDSLRAEKVGVCRSLFASEILQFARKKDLISRYACKLSRKKKSLEREHKLARKDLISRHACKLEKKKKKSRVRTEACAATFKKKKKVTSEN